MVIDSSITLSWYFEDERTVASKAVLDRVVAQGAVAPALWRLEVANGLAMAIRRKRITPAVRDEALLDLAAVAVAIDPDTDSYVWSETVGMADHHRLTIYDATYLELAQRRRLPLATLDEALQTAARSLGTTVLGAS